MCFFAGMFFLTAFPSKVAFWAHHGFWYISAVVVAEFAHPDDMCWVDVEIEHGLYTSRFARSISSAEEAFSASSLLLREAAHLLERVASVAEPSVDDLLREAASVEQDVEAALSS